MTLKSFAAPLFVPGNRPDRFEKAAASGADAIIIDLEDAVPADAKYAARAALRVDFTKLPVLVRINAENSSWHRDDLAAVSNLPVAAIMVPKAELGGNLAALASLYKRPVVALVETARGIAQARAIAELEGVSRLAFGSVDFCVDIGCAHTRDALLSARNELVLASRLAGIVPPLDGVTTSFDNVGLIESDARHAFELGFGGKLAIHPRQITPIRTGFLPRPAEIEWANRVLASADGASAVDRAMVDEPVRGRAQAILARSAFGTPFFS